MRKSPFDFGHYLTQSMSKFHWGLDIVAVKEGTSQAWIGAPVHPILKGKVILTWVYQGGLDGNDRGGTWVMIQSQKDRVDYYGHLKSLNVSVGQSVDENTVLGWQGSTGPKTGLYKVTGEHLHLESRIGKTWKDGNAIDPFVDTTPQEIPSDMIGYNPYTVQSGDTLWGIAERYLGDGNRCREIKGPFTDPNKIDVGMIVYIPSKYNPPIAFPPPIQHRTYTTKKGDTLWGIADRELNNGNRWKEIHGWEKYGDPKDMPVGIVLLLPLV